MTINIAISIAVAFGAIYFITFYRFAFRFPRIYPELWKELNCPESLGIRGQMTYLAVALGLERKVPIERLHQVRKEIIVIRISFGIAFIAFAVAFVLIG